jgi:hypothetical protein
MLRALACTAVLLVACDRRVEPWVEAADEPAPSQRPVRIPGLAQAAPEPLPVAGGGAGETIRGSLRLQGGAAAIPTGSVLFVIARPQAGGPPLAVKRLPAGPFPMSFEIGPRDAMLEGRPFAGPIVLSARVDADGDPMTRGPEDLVAVSESPLEPGAGAVDLVLAPASP